MSKYHSIQIQDILIRARSLANILTDAAGGAEVQQNSMDASSVSMTAMMISELIAEAEAAYSKEKQARKVRLVETG